MGEWNGYYVVSFHLFPEKGMTQPFEAKIIGDLGNYWKLQVGRKVVTANKGACSSVPYKDATEKRSPEYRASVERKIGRSLELDDPVDPVTPDPEQSELAKAMKRVDGKAKAKPKAKPKTTKPEKAKPFGDLLDF